MRWAYICPHCHGNKAKAWRLRDQGPVRCADCGYRMVLEALDDEPPTVHNPS